MKLYLILTWYDKFVSSNDVKATVFAITYTKRYVPVVTLSTQDNSRLLEQLKSGFKRTISWNKYDQRRSVYAPNRYFSINPSVQGVNKDNRTVHTKYYLPTVEMKDNNVMIDGQSFFDQTVKNNLITYDNDGKIVFGQGDDYTIGCLLLYCKCVSQFYFVLI